ncbi:MAG TPA: FAD:protein FMN transferase [Baekduia sp.]|uniref:FAD:protein FMN transferase n=1 Tax=Baekduia sp. TaxID=2600305 RepID=UPI002C9164FD|nr:FAD:protein FMN transferase [Baekduia sp.]HMJ34015.1 FAD:protein FMN transferase [Baekduia sp.]
MSRLDVSFPAMGGQARLLLADRAPGDAPSQRLLHAAADARALLADLEARWTRFDPDSDVARLTADPRHEVPAHAHVRALVRAGAWAGRVSGGLVDMTLGDELARAGYAGHWDGATASLPEVLAAAPARTPAMPHPAARWHDLGVDGRAQTIRRPPGVTLDSGGLGKGLAADLVAARLVGLRYVVDVGGDLAIGHGGGGLHEIAVEDPLRPGAGVHRLRLGAGGVATSGIHRRLWLGADGRPGHHLLDPATGRPAWTGLLAATAVGRTALEAEIIAKVALLRGPSGGRAALAALGGVLVGEGGKVEVVPPLRRAAARTVRALAETAA